MSDIRELQADPSISEIVSRLENVDTFYLLFAVRAYAVLYVFE